MRLQSITASEAKRLIDRGAILVDIREANEHASERIPGAGHIALSKLEEADLAARRGQTVLFHCRSGARTQANSGRLAAKAGACQAFIVEGGIEGWRRAGLPTSAGAQNKPTSRLARWLRAIGPGLRKAK